MTKKKPIYPASVLCDFYKVSHMAQYPENTEVVYSTWTPRDSMLENIKEVVAFGFQGFLKHYTEYFEENFFSRDVEDVVHEFKRYMEFALGQKNPKTSHIRELHELGYLPIKVRAVPEGLSVPVRIPMLTIENTDYRFFWITNYLETLMSASLWQPSTSATIAKRYRNILDKFALETTGSTEGVQFQGHDFSMRGMGGLEAAAQSGAGHLLSFVGTDTIPAISYMEAYYNCDMEKYLIGTSVPASEHSTATSNIITIMNVQNVSRLKAEEIYLKKFITEIYPTGFASYVSDSYDLWGVVSKCLPALKDEIMNRDGRLVIRPDSGDPCKIICGDPKSDNEYAKKGLIECLWDIFGGTVNEQGYKVLDSHIGALYGDAITIERCKTICEDLKAKKFASTNVVFGIGSYTYQYKTRDTFGFALKSTFVQVNGEPAPIYKDPATDTKKIKKSNIGMVTVVVDPESYSKDTPKLMCIDNLVFDAEVEELENMYIPIMRTIYEDGELLVDDSLEKIRYRMVNGMKTNPNSLC